MSNFEFLKTTSMHADLSPEDDRELNTNQYPISHNYTLTYPTNSAGISSFDRKPNTSRL